jgi:dolichyl-phosphate-mannose--protein O-mannosyl transferase
MGTASTEQPLTWFVLPAYYILNYFQSPDGRFLLLCAFTNQATWLAVWPSVGRMWRKAGEEKKLALPLLVFAFVYLPFTFIALTGRPVYPYSATSLAALATFFAAYLFITLYEHPKSRPYVLALISLAFITSIILYPFAAGFPVSSDLYQPVTKFYSYFVVSK